MKGAISYSLYGERPFYVLGLYDNLRAAPHIYPGWDVVVHTEKGHYAIPRLKALGAKVIEHPTVPGSRGMFWRFETFADPSYSHVIVRDADSRLTERDKACTDAWIASDKILHVIRDHEAHFHKAIIGGAFGVKAGGFSDIAYQIQLWPHNNRYGDDESFLGQVLWPRHYPSSFLRHNFQPGSHDDTPLPHHSRHIHICQPQTPSLASNISEVVLLSPDHYANRRRKFEASLRTSDLLSQFPLTRAPCTPPSAVVRPSHFQHSSCAHYYPATRDHIAILERSLLAGHDLVFVFEDDAKFHPEFDSYLMRAWESLPKDWDSVMLGGQNDDKRRYVRGGDPQKIAWVEGSVGMHGNLWCRPGLRAFYDFATAHPSIAVDNAYGRFQCSSKKVFSPARWIVEIDGIQFGKDS